VQAFVHVTRQSGSSTYSTLESKPRSLHITRPMDVDLYSSPFADAYTSHYVRKKLIVRAIRFC